VSVVWLSPRRLFRAFRVPVVVAVAAAAVIVAPRVVVSVVSHPAGIGGGVRVSPASSGGSGSPDLYFYFASDGHLWFPANWPGVYWGESLSAEFDCDFPSGTQHFTGYGTMADPYMYAPFPVPSNWPGSFWTGVQCDNYAGHWEFVPATNIVLRDPAGNVVWSGATKEDLLRALGVGGGNSTRDARVCNQGSRPVTCSSGDFWHTFTDVAIPARGVPGVGLGVRRTYNSLSAGVGGPFGFGWACSFCVTLSIDGGGTARITQENGSQAVFAADGSGGFASPAGQYATLVRNADGTYTYSRRGEDVLMFTAGGALRREADPDGDGVSFGRDASGRVTSIADDAGRALTLAYGADGHVASVSDPLGRTTTYGYDSAGDLTSSTDPAGHTWSFGYDANHVMTSMTDPDGGVTTNTYDAAARVLTQTDPANRETDYAGRPRSPTRRVT
jgi:YD repeat-containing protein